MSYKERAHPGEIKIEKSKIHFSKEPIDVSNVDIERILESNKHFFWKKDFKWECGFKNHD